MRFARNKRDEANIRGANSTSKIGFSEFSNVWSSSYLKSCGIWKTWTKDSRLIPSFFSVNAVFVVFKSFFSNNLICKLRKDYKSFNMTHIFTIKYKEFVYAIDES